MRVGTSFRISVISVVLFAVLPRCFNVPEFPDQKEIKDLRILAIRADPPLARPGEDVTLRALVVSPDGEAGDAAHRWWWCGGTSGTEGAANCAPQDDPELDRGRERTAIHRVPEGVLDQKSVLVKVYGFRDVVNLEVQRGDERARAFKRIQVLGGGQNRNPVMHGLHIEGAAAEGDAFVVSPGKEYRLMPEADFSASERFSAIDFALNTVELEEEYMFAWYATGGKLDDGVTRQSEGSATKWEAPGESPAQSKPLFVYVVLHDGRGGNDWWVQKVHVRR
ncbi:MAG: hypothetical protein HY897_04575 [Deltaproteobacteria bacterium]|nr:hypothetical protein [Deltaproteobacteria bacterium]